MGSITSHRTHRTERLPDRECADCGSMRRLQRVGKVLLCERCRRHTPSGNVARRRLVVEDVIGDWLGDPEAA